MRTRKVPDTVQPWKPNVTVAAVAHRDGAFLMVREQSLRGPVINQPAGHLERGESLEQAVRRETLEETGWTFEPRSVVGVYLWRSPENGVTYLRVCFAGIVIGHDPERELDEGILEPVWLNLTALRESRAEHRSPLVMRCIEDFLGGNAYPLELLHHCVDMDRV